MEIVLSIAGSDPSAGAGVQQDLKTITALGCYGCTVITALTTQNTQGVQDVKAVDGEVVAAQLQSLIDDLDIAAIKIGQIPTRGVAEAIIGALKPHLSNHSIPVVYDPVMVSTSGRRMMDVECVEYVKNELFPFCTLITPNLPETEVLWGNKIRTTENIEKAGRYLTEKYATAFLVKGGHAEGEEMTDRLYRTDGTTEIFNTKKITSGNLHGTGCTLSSAIASLLAKGQSLSEAVEGGKAIVNKGIEKGRLLRIGKGNGPLWLFNL